MLAYIFKSGDRRNRDLKETEKAKTSMRISWCRPKGRAARKYLAGRFQGRQGRTRVSVDGAG